MQRWDPAATLLYVALSRSRAKETEMISRRTMLSFLGLGTASALAAPIAIVAASDAEAQTLGMQRRHDRGVGRHDRRMDRRPGGPRTAGAEGQRGAPPRAAPPAARPTPSVGAWAPPPQPRRRPTT